MYSDLRGFIKIVEERGDLKRITGADPNLEIGALTVIVGRSGPAHPALLFEGLKGYDRSIRILTNTISTLARSKLAFGIEPDADVGDAVQFLAEKLSRFHPTPPKEVSDGPVMENVQKKESVNLLKFPAPKWHLLDGGRYLGTGTLVILRDPETGDVNLGAYRIQLHGKATLGISINPGHHGAVIRDKYWEKGKSCPVAFTLGHDPRLATAADASGPFGTNEYNFAGWLRGNPVEVIPGPVTGLPIPKDAELAIEGEIPPLSVEAHDEGPFGEFGGYYSVESTPQPVIRVKAVYHRNDPILFGSPPFRGVRHDGVLPFADATLLFELRRAGFPEVRKIGRVGPFMVISLTVRYPGHARRIADFVMSGVGMRPPKFVFLVDDDIDPGNRDDVFWAFSRVDATESVYPVKNRWGSPTDPRIPPEKKSKGDVTASSLIFDGTRPWHWRESFPKPTDFPKEMLEEYRKKWAKQLG